MSAAKCNTEGALESLSSVQRAAGGREEEGREGRSPGERELRKRDANLDANYNITSAEYVGHVVGSKGQTKIDIQLFCI